PSPAHIYTLSLHDALPIFRVTPDFTVLPSMMKSTVPAGAPAPGLTALTVAVNVTVCPNSDGLWSEDTAKLVSALLTVWPGDSEPLLFLKLPSVSLKLTVTVCTGPETASVEVWKVAWPLLRATPDFTVLPSMMKSTVPAGMPAPGLTA